MSNEQNKLGDRVALLRNKMEISQSELARRIGKQPQTIQKIEKGGNARGATLEALAKVLNTSKTYLLVGDSATQIDVTHTDPSALKYGLLVEWRHIGLTIDEIRNRNLVLDNIALIQDNLDGDIVCAVIEDGDWMNLLDNTIAYVKRDIELNDVKHDSLIVLNVNDKCIIRKLVIDGDKKIAISTNKNLPKSEYEVTAENFIGVVKGLYMSV
ncbi:helix-turn-helix domain-containing protein [Acinetobacter sp. A47]|uniref:helix-turn-helix domain-containing protein n=1 Tax=Acinetobacter sp. A47 TaxID=1561217 RepID=UPI00068F332C|nr:helix-turn-helix transcriptional regulator [Acinetobacter sp. A47]